jgi:undecaprenyl-diphosphatase
MEESAIEEIGEGMLPYERDLFLFLNRHHSEFWDNFMMLYSGKLFMGSALSGFSWFSFL